MKKTIALVICVLMLATASVSAYKPNKTQIVKLCEKDTNTWECQSGVKKIERYFSEKLDRFLGRKTVRYATGIVRYKEQGQNLDLFLSTSRIEDYTADYQVTLVGQGGTPADALLAAACENPNQGAVWECGYWGDQGFYNFHIGKLGGLRLNKHMSRDRFEVELPAGMYEGVKFLVKQNEAPWNTYLYETKTLNFEIVG